MTGSSALSWDTAPALTMASNRTPSIVRTLGCLDATQQRESHQQQQQQPRDTYICIPLHPVPQNPINSAHCRFGRRCLFSTSSVSLSLLSPPALPSAPAPRVPRVPLRSRRASLGPTFARLFPPLRPSADSPPCTVAAFRRLPPCTVSASPPSSIRFADSAVSGLAAWSTDSIANMRGSRRDTQGLTTRRKMSRYTLSLNTSEHQRHRHLPKNCVNRVKLPSYRRVHNRLINNRRCARGNDSSQSRQNPL